MVPAIAMVIATVGCGGGESGDNGEGGTAPSETAAENEDELARSMLLTVDDFPSGWSEVPSEDEEESPFDKCDPGDPEGRTGGAETGDFSRGGNASVSEQVAIFETPEQVATRLSALPGLGACLTRVVDDGDLDNDAAEFFRRHVRSVRFPTVRR
jgi:hypothetical protein